MAHLHCRGCRPRLVSSELASAKWAKRQLTTTTTPFERLVPLSVPPNRRAQTSVVCVWGFILPITLFIFLYLW